AHMANKEPELARDTLARAVALNPRKPQFRYMLASFLTVQKDYKGALREIDDLLREKPGDAQALQAAAEVHLAAGDAPAAEAALKRIVQAAPDAAVGYYRLAQLYASQKKTAAAIAQLELAAARAPRDLAVLGSLATLLLQDKKADRALAVVREAAAAQAD